MYKGILYSPSGRKDCRKEPSRMLYGKAKYGHPGNPSVQAARRICDKRNWDWKNYDPKTYTEE